MARAPRAGMTAIEWYLEITAAEGQLPPAGLAAQAQDLGRLAAFAHGRAVAVEDLDVEALEAFLVAADPATLAGLSAIATCEAFFRFLVVDDRIRVNPFAGLLRRRTPAAGLVRRHRAELG